MTYYTKVKQAEKEIQNQTFESAVIFDSEGNFLVWEDGKESHVNLAKFEGKMKGNILTHNHPKGSSFSMEDIKYFLYNGLKEIRAVSAQHTFALELRKEVKDVQAELKKLEEKLPQVIKELKQVIKMSIINDTDCYFEDIDHEAIKMLFKGSRTFKYTHTVA